MYDYHIHTLFSDDSNSTVTDMIDAACDLGYLEVALTDHYDPAYPNRNLPFDLDFSGYERMLEHVSREYLGKIHIVKGIEIGLQEPVLKKCSAAVSAYNYDFIIGSFHCAEGKELYGGDFFKDKSIKQSYIDFYTYMYNCLSVYKDYSVVGHFNIIDRYSAQLPPDSVYFDIVETIFKKIIDDGKGIEINTSSFRYGMGDRRTPATEILRLYKELGGDIITIGSDAHYPKHVGYKIGHMPEYLKSIGFKYLTTFRDKKPIQNIMP
jgi:histidinol-phosphatase (PHP family)